MQIDCETHDIAVIEAARLQRRVVELEAALRNARAQLVTIGGEALHVHGDKIQRAVLSEIDLALQRQ